MKVVWALERATVRDVYEHLRSRRTIAYTTVLTMMKILEQKGYVTKTREERAFVYRPARPRHETRPRSPRIPRGRSGRTQRTPAGRARCCCTWSSRRN